MTVPHWSRDPRPDERTAEVCIVGAGIAGVSAALHLHAQGVDALVLDRSALASGASGRNAGFLMRGAADNYLTAINQYGRDRARDLWRLTEDNLALLRTFDIESIPTYQRIPSCLLALEDDTENTELRQSADLLREDGFRVEWITSGDDHAWRSGLIHAGLLNPDDAACNPAHLLAHLARQLPTPVIAPAEVHAVDRDGPDLLVRTPALAVRCRRLLICTNAYAPLLLPQLDAVISPNRGQMLALDDTTTRLDCSYYAHRGGEYFRRPDSGTVVVGGWRRFFEHDERTRDDRTTDGVQRGLESFIRPLTAGPAPVKARWSGTMAFTPDGLPIADRLDPDARTWFIGGFNGHGMSMACRTAELAVEALLKDAPAPFPLSRFPNHNPGLPGGATREYHRTTHDGV